MLDLGYVPVNATIRIPWDSFAASTGAPAATTNYAAADVKIYKDGSTTERSSSNGITATTDFDSRTGLNLAIIDLSDNSDSGFYAAGSEYLVCIDTVTIDGQSVRFWLARFMIGVQPANVSQWSGTAVASPDTAGYPKVTIKSGTGAGEISLSSGGVAVRGNIKKAAAFAKLMFLMTDSTNHNPATGKTVTVTISKDGGSFASLNSGDSVTEVGNGIYEVDLDATDTNFNNAVLRATASGCDDTLVHLFTEI